MSQSAPLLPGVPPIESPLFASMLADMDLSAEEQAYAQALHEHGFAVIDFPDPDILERMDRIQSRLAVHFGIDGADAAAVARLGGPRIQDAWQNDDDVKAIAANPQIISLLSRIYQRQAIPFQTLNFPVGTQQHPHSDSVHFSSMPERFMCGVWLAFEDIHPDAGPLVYYPGSHKWPVITNAMVGRLGWQTHSDNAQAYAEAAWRGLIEATGIRPATFAARRGQALIWAANLLHGGSARNNLELTRWSQVTHYYFEDCVYYTPAFSDECLGRFDIREIINVGNGEKVESRFLGVPVERTAAPASQRKGRGWFGRWRKRVDHEDQLPPDFDPDTYFRLNPDVAAAGDDAARHYLAHGRAEGRRYQDG